MCHMLSSSAGHLTCELGLHDLICERPQKLYQDHGKIWVGTGQPDKDGPAQSVFCCCLLALLRKGREIHKDSGFVKVPVILAASASRALNLLHVAKYLDACDLLRLSAKRQSACLGNMSSSLLAARALCSLH